MATAQTVASATKLSQAGSALARKLLSQLQSQYTKAGGCQSCLNDNAYSCVQTDKCQQPAADAALLNDVRTLILDVQDLSSAREKTEFVYPAHITTSVDLSSWEGYLTTRGFNDAANSRTQRALSKPLTYPITLAQLFSPSQLPLTDDGTDVFAALGNRMWSGNARPFRICILGARAESTLPAENWAELSLLYPKAKIEFLFVGPEIHPGLRGRTRQFSASISSRYYHSLYHHVHDELMVGDMLPDLYVAFNPGVGHKIAKKYWAPTLQFILETRRPLVITSHSTEDARDDVSGLEEFVQTNPQNHQWHWLLHQMVNPFRSLRPDVHPKDIHNIIWSNRHILIIQGR